MNNNFIFQEEIDMELFDSITFNEFYKLLNGRYRKTQARIAEDLNISTKTLSRWINNSSSVACYSSLSNGKYIRLFQSLENECSANDDNISNVLIEHFSLPKEYSKMTYQQLKEIFIYNFDYRLEKNNKSRTKYSPQENKETYFGSRQFLENCLENKDDIESIYMAFHSGWEFWDDREMRNLLKQLNNSGISINVIANPDSAVKPIAMTMRDLNLTDEYISFNENLSKWADRVDKLDNISFRVSEYPILRKIYIAKYKDNTIQALFRDYVYEYAPDVNSSFIQLSDKNPFLAIFQREFDFLWSKGKTYSDWVSTLPKQEELMLLGQYCLLYLSHKKHLSVNENSNEFIISKLSIENDNMVKLYVNIPNVNDNVNTAVTEYTYHGKIKLTRNNIFMSLYDKTEQEYVSMTFFRPLYDKKRLLGVITALSPNGQPVAFKCACIGQSIMSKINIQKLKQILSRNNQEWNNSLIILEEQDINNFYSNQIFEDELTH